MLRCRARPAGTTQIHREQNRGARFVVVVTQSLMLR